MFSCDFCEISKNTLFTEPLRTTASEKDQLQTAYSIQGKPFFLFDRRCFGQLGKFQHKIEISIKTTRVSKLSFRLLCLSLKLSWHHFFIISKLTLSGPLFDY